MPSYIALIRKERSSDYGVDFPDFPGCVSAGVDLDDARQMAAEALALHVEGMLADGEALPAPSTLDVIMHDQTNQDAVGFLVDVPAPASVSVRVNVTLPQQLLEAIDRVAANRSRFLAEAARSKLRSG